MSYQDIDVGLTDEEIAMRDMVRKFGAEVVRPAGIELDKLADPTDVTADGSVLWDVFKKFRELGLHKIGIPKKIGGMAEDLTPMARYLISEEMGYADTGLAISLSVSGSPFAYCAMSDVPELKELAVKYAADTDCEMIGCWAITEPDHGGDWSLGRNDPRCGPSLMGELKGDEYELNGQKSAWVSNGTIATHATVHVNLNPDLGMWGHGICILPLDLPGISRGKPLDKIGQRPLNQGEIFFDNVRIPKEFMVVPNVIEMYQQARASGQALRRNPAGGMAVTFGGLARAAFDEAHKYAKERVQGGVPIIEHKNIKLKLFKMFMMVEAARASARRSYMNFAFGDNPSPAHATAGKWLSTETAFRVASEAIQIYGGNGLTKEYVIEKIFRDARASMIEDGVNETLALAAIDTLGA